MRRLIALTIVLALMVPIAGMAASLSTPKNFTIRATGPTILTLTWKSVAGAKKYEIQVKDGNKWKKITSSSKTTYTHKGLKAGMKYSYRVRAISGKNASGFATKSEQVPRKGTINNPSIVGIYRKGMGVDIEWRKLKGMKEMEIYRSTDNATFARIARVKGTTKFSDYSAPKNTNVFYMLRAYNSQGLGVYGKAKNIMISSLPYVNMNKWMLFDKKWKKVWQSPSGDVFDAARFIESYPAAAIHKTIILFDESEQVSYSIENFAVARSRHGIPSRYTDKQALELLTEYERTGQYPD